MNTQTFSKPTYRKTQTALLLILLIAMPTLTAISIEPASAQATTVLTPKWSVSGLGSNWEGGLVIGDVTGDGREDIVYAGGGSDAIYVLNGGTGARIATYTNSRIGQYCQPQLYDINGDGVLDILVPLYYEPGLAAVRYDGDSSLQQMWVANIQRVSGESTPSGSVMAKPVAGDIDGDGDLDIFIASQDVSPVGMYDGTIVRLTHQGVEVARTFAWRACSGGLSLADTDGDGVFELYQGDRQMGYRDGGYGKGTRSFWAENLTERWNRLDFLSSSQAPVLADVNNDGILDVLAGMYREMNILNSANGEWINRVSDSSMSVHYGVTVFDIDGDGHLELLCNDGDHDDDPYTDVYDLVTGAKDAQLSLLGGDSKWSPLVADIDPTHPGFEIISVPNGTSLENGYWRGAILVYSSNYQLLQSISRFSGSTLGSQLAYPVVQDIDGDGKLELVTHSSTGTIYAFDTQAPNPAQRIRSEVTFFGEKRTGAAVYEPAPWAPNYWTAPLVAANYPADNTLSVPTSTAQLSFKTRDHQANALTYSVTTSPNIGSRSGQINTGTYNWNTITVPVSGLAYDTTYTWTVTVSDASQTTQRTYSFRTQQAPYASNVAPTQGTPTLAGVNGVSAASTFQCTSQSTTDANGDQVTNIYRWTVNGNPVAKLLLPFNTRGGTSTADYSGYGNDGLVKGATWVPNGKVGGAYSFDGKDDAIIISDGGRGYFNNRTYTAYPNHEELGGYGNWNGVTVEAWIYLTENNYGTRVIGKIPSYALGFQSSSTSPNRITASVWPAQYQIADDDNRASTDRERSVSYSQSLQLRTWYHIAFTYQNGVGLRLYLNGELVSQSSAITGPIKESRGEPVYIGSLVEPFAGMIDEVQLYGYAQPAEQIRNSYLESRDGGSSSSMFIPSGIGVAGNTLACQVTPTDSWANGAARNSPSIIIGSGQQPTDYILSVNINGGGSVTRNPNQASYSAGTDVTLTAVPNPGWIFSGWSGDLTGSTNPATITMNSNKAVTATFVQTYSLTVNVVGSGSVTKNPDQLTYPSGSTVQLTANPAAGWALSSWTGDATGSATTIEVTMNANKAITATFTENSGPYTLTVNVVGQGIVTKNPDSAQYTSGTQVTLTPQAASGWTFTGWSGDLSGNANPATITMDTNKAVTATFTADPSGDYLLEDNFETGDFSKWTTISQTSGETASITTSSVYAGSYSASFSTNGGGGYEKAYLRSTLDPSASSVYVQGTFKLTQNGLTDSTDRVKLIELRAGSTIIAAAGIIQRSGQLQCWLETRDGTSWVEIYRETAVDFSNWFTLELQWQSNASTGGGTLLINGESVIQVGNDNTSNYGSCTEVRVGLPEAYNCGATTIALDNVIINDQPIS